ncbi:DegV family protein [Nocardioides sp. BP30]|uniref:DegV family protein n=1 Tax=Nocardioides sp. BP30 TaxID=3036374 RepID=UPI002468AA04|nr:DegV family protein [Nocardioides sp. BP30]WGL51155.1 DegV family protein [Nocardioides sp. BP30]
MPSAPKVAVVTDSTALYPSGEAPDGVSVVPLEVIIDGESFPEGDERASPDAVVAAFAAKRNVTTSRPAPATMRETYARLAAEGYAEILSIHLSADMSGTFESAQLAARESAIPVVALDTRAVGPGVGFAASAAVAAVRRGASATEAALVAKARAEATRSLIYVDSLEPMRRGGRIGTAAALLGSALAVKPLLTLDDGRIKVLEKVRTAQRALARMEELALEAAGDGPVEVAVAHLAAAERAERLADSLSTRLGDRLRSPVRCGQVGAGLGAHVGPGMVAVVVTPAL